MGSDLATSTVGIFADSVKVYMDNNKEGAEDKSQLKLHGQAALAPVRSIDHLAVGAIKKGMVDIPLALAEGFRNAPRLWVRLSKNRRKSTAGKVEQLLLARFVLTVLAKTKSPAERGTVLSLGLLRWRRRFLLQTI